MITFCMLKQKFYEILLRIDNAFIDVKQLSINYESMVVIQRLAIVRVSSRMITI